MNEGPKLQEFCKQALGLLGASVTEESSGVVAVSMPLSMLDLFEGRPSLRLAFDPEKVEEGVDLVLPGSYVLERLLEAVRLRGKIAQFRIPPSTDALESTGVELLNAETRLVSTETSYNGLLLVNYKISLISDEDQDYLYSVVVDPAVGSQVQAELPALLSSSDAIPPSELQDDRVDLTAGFSCARNLAEEYARERADAVQHSIDQRLAAEISRLNTYYQDLLMDESSGGRGADMKKIQRHRIKASSGYRNLSELYEQVGALLADVKTPEELRDHLKEKSHDIQAELDYDRARLTIVGAKARRERVRQLESEKKKLEKLGPIARKIAKHPPESWAAKLEEMKQQSLDELKRKSELEELSGFDPDAAKQLETLRSGFEAEKAQRIAELEDKFQLKVLVSPVSASLIRYPRTKRHYAAVNGAESIPFIVSHDLVTGKTELPLCSSCHQPVSTAYACACGHLVCPACERKCSGCGKEVCADCAAGSCHVCASALCKDCLSTCSVCGKPDCHNHSTKCKSCGREVCKSEGNGSCSITCAICGSDFCREHSKTCPICGSNVCLDDMRKCSKCRKEGCLVDVVDCSCCGKAVCSKHRETCRICGQPVCGSCIGREEGYCSTCRGLFRAKECGPAIESIIAEVAGERVRRKSRWMASENRNQFILVRRGPLMQVYVLDKATGALRSRRRLGFFESLLVRLGPHRP